MSEQGVCTSCGKHDRVCRSCGMCAQCAVSSNMENSDSQVECDLCVGDQLAYMGMINDAWAVKVDQLQAKQAKRHMKQHTATWTVKIKMKARFADLDSPTSKVEYSVNGSYAEGNIDALACVARSMVELLQAAEKVVMPCSRRQIVEAIEEELDELHIGHEEHDA